MSGVLVVIAQPGSDELNQAEGEALGLGLSLADALGEPLACALIG
ncbi:MAG: electron transfer flavoprotein subunit alpha/FixB family protein, partial [Chloroflexi bacterium]|nr:electron transfer flavoprotein subunit alpha/FixB family protein [Chloroflexota bacterium]